MDHFGVIEKRLWSSADNLRANSNFASNEYFMPVMGLIFLRHAYSRYLKLKDQIEATLPKRNGKVRDLTKNDFSQKGAIFLKPEAQFDHLAELTDCQSARNFDPLSASKIDPLFACLTAVWRGGVEPLGGTPERQTAVRDLLARLMTGS